MKTNPQPINSNLVAKRPAKGIGYNFISPEFLPAGKDEYHLRDLQNRNGINYRVLTAYEIETLVRNSNTSDDWNKICVSDAFNPDLVKNCKFFGLVRIGKLEPVALEYHNVCMPVGLYNSTIISCDFGDNVVISNVNYMSHYVVGTEAMIVNVHELHTTSHAKFGNGIIKDGEEESLRIWMEVCNENAGRKIIPFTGMLPGDAYLWSKYRGDTLLMDKLKELTERKFDKQRGYYGKIGDRTVIKNTSIIKDVWIGSDAYIKGANKLKNLTINSSYSAPSQIGEGCELVNGIVDFGCRIFYGAKAVRFLMASHSQLKYGARLINSYLGNNATISCCEVLNSLIFPAHEQHHNNSFLCASLVMGQSNIAAGATIGSNHNSRAADGELVAGRGFWPGLCVSLKHNSKFASYTLIAKGDFASELNISLPFSLISNDVSNNQLVIMPAYWFMYNMYALARNAHKYIDRDKRTDKIQHIEYEYLAPDTVSEIFDSLQVLARCTAIAHGFDASSMQASELQEEGRKILDQTDTSINSIEVTDGSFENAKRPALLVKVGEAYSIYKELVVLYGVTQLMQFAEEHQFASFEMMYDELPNQPKRQSWKNIGGQLIPENEFTDLIAGIKDNTIPGWDEVHEFYRHAGETYPDNKREHSFASLLELLQITKAEFNSTLFIKLLDEGLETRKWMAEKIYTSREKDYHNDFKKMVYDNDEEMNVVVGALDENSFILEQQEALQVFAASVEKTKLTFQNSKSYIARPA